MGKQLRRMSEEEIIAMAMRRADAEYEAAVARGKARFEREQARETPANETPAEPIRMECPNCGGAGGWHDETPGAWAGAMVRCDVCGGTGYGVEMPRETSETTAADAVAEMRECAVCGQVRADCVNQTPASETEVADIYVCEECRDALAAGECA